jgi:hypothetical protein
MKNSKPGKVPYNLPSGKTVWLTNDQIDKVDIQELMAYDSGDYIDDPFTDSSLVGRRIYDDEVDDTILLLPEEDLDIPFGDEE